MSFHLAHHLESKEELKVHHDTAAILAALWYTLFPAIVIIDPIDEVPSRQVFDTSVCLLVSAEIMQDAFGSRHEVTQKIIVLAIAHIVVQGIDVTQSVRRDVLALRSWVAALGATFGIATLVGLGQEVLDHSLVTSIVQGDECLYASVAEILELFVVRAIHVGLVSTKTGSAPTDLENLL